VFEGVEDLLMPRRTPQERSAATRKWQEKQPGGVRGVMLKALHRMEWKEYQALLKKQRNRCAICKEKFIKTPFLDHQHGCCSNRVSCRNCNRGLLCRFCNYGLHFLEKEKWFVAAQAYLKEYS
jgi:hypothetical protein